MPATQPTEPTGAARSAAVRRPGRRMRRRIADLAFRAAGLGATVLAVLALVMVLTVITRHGWIGLHASRIQLEVPFDRARAGLEDPSALLRDANWRPLMLDTLYRHFPEQERSRRQSRALPKLVAPGWEDILHHAAAHPASHGVPRVWGREIRLSFPLAQDLDLNFRIGRPLSAAGSDTGDARLPFYSRLIAAGEIRVETDWGFLVRQNARDAERAGILGALMGTFWLLAVTLVLTLPIGVLAGIYLHEIAPRGRLRTIIELNVNNLAAVPSILFGLLGLAVFLDLFGMRRSTPLVGGMVLSMMTLPVQIIATRAALASVPFAVREGAMALGASRIRCVFDQVLPLALPGIATGSILGLARAIGETAPLIMIGMVAFVIGSPTSPADPAAALPVQIFLWADLPEPLFIYRASAAILVLVAILFVMNFAALAIRRRFGR